LLNNPPSPHGLEALPGGKSDPIRGPGVGRQGADQRPQNLCPASNGILIHLPWVGVGLLPRRTLIIFSFFFFFLVFGFFLGGGLSGFNTSFMDMDS